MMYYIPLYYRSPDSKVGLETVLVAMSDLICALRGDGEKHLQRYHDPFPFHFCFGIAHVAKAPICD